MTSPASPLARRLRGWPGGVALMLVGAVVALAGLLQTTTSHGNPNVDCANGSVLVAKFNFAGNKYVFEKPAGNGSVVTITNGSKNGGSWSSTLKISSVIVKGGPNSHVTSITPAQQAGSFSNSGLPKVGNGKRPDVSNVQFCGPTATVTTTTSTSTTVKPTTTTAKPTTTTTSTTTTTAAPTTTTAKATTTTVDLYATTTEAPTTTVAPTTTAKATTTTSTTTTVPATTTTDLGSTGSTVTTGPSTTVPGSTTTTAVEVEGISQTTTPHTTSTTIVSGTDVRGRSLPRTGSTSAPLVTIGLILLLAGVAMTVVGARRDRA